MILLNTNSWELTVVQKLTARVSTQDGLGSKADLMQASRERAKHQQQQQQQQKTKDNNHK